MSLRKRGFSAFATIMKAPLTYNLPGLSRGVLRDFANQLLSEELSVKGKGTFSAENACLLATGTATSREGGKRLRRRRAESGEEKPSNLLDFKSDLMQRVHVAVEQTLGNVADPSVGLNAVIRKIVSGLPFGKADGQVAAKDEIMRIGLGGSSSIAISNLTIQGLDTAKNLSAIEALDSYTTRSSIGLGYPLPGLPAAIEISIDLLPADTPYLAGDPLKADLRLSLGLGELYALIELFLQLNIDSLSHLQIGQTLNAKCLASAVEPKGIAISKLVMSLGECALRLECIECGDNTALERLSELGNEKEWIAFLTEYVNGYMKQIMKTASSSKSKKTIASSLQTIGAECLTMEEAEEKEKAEASQPISAGADVTIAIIFVSAILGGLGILVVILARRVIGALAQRRRMRSRGKGKKRRTSSKGYSLQNEDKNIIQLELSVRNPPALANPAKGNMLHERGKTSSFLYDEQIDITTSLANHPRISACSKCFVPILLLASAGLYFSSHISVMASCNIRLLLGNGGDKVSIHANQLLEYSLVDVVKKLWEADAYSVSAILILFGAVWPYVKLAATALCWACSPSLLGPDERGRILRWLDVLGKWQIIEQMIITLVMVISFVQILLPNEENRVVDAKFFRLVEAFEPHWGYFAFIWGALTSLLVNQMVLYNHRNIIATGWLTVNKRRSLFRGEDGKHHVKCPSSWFNAGTTDVRGNRQNLAARTRSLYNHHFRGWKRMQNIKVTNKVRALYEHVSETPNELSFKVGHTIIVTERDDPGGGMDAMKRQAKRVSFHPILLRPFLPRKEDSSKRS